MLNKQITKEYIEHDSLYIKSKIGQIKSDFLGMHT